MSTLSREESRIRTVCLLILAGVALAAALVWTRTVMIPFVLAILLSYLVSPLVDILQVRLRFPRWAAVIGALLAGVVLLGLLALLLSTSTNRLIANAHVYRDRLTALAASGLSVLDRFGIDLGQDAFLEAMKKLPILGFLKGAAGSVVDLLSNSLLVMIFVIYLLAGRAPAERREGIYGEMDTKIRRYLVTKVTTSAATGLLVGTILWLLGLELAFVFGVLAFLLNFIPSVGSLIATLLPLPIALIQFQSGWAIGAAVFLPGLVQMVIGNGIEPKLMGESLDLHPVVILLALMFWGLAWGVVGMLLATPITAVARIAFSRSEMTRPLAELLAGRLPQAATAEVAPGH
jgi:AI-2 transport protein TqsA